MKTQIAKLSILLLLQGGLSVADDHRNEEAEENSEENLSESKSEEKPTGMAAILNSAVLGMPKAPKREEKKEAESEKKETKASKASKSAAKSTPSTATKEAERKLASTPPTAEAEPGKSDAATREEKKPVEYGKLGDANPGIQFKEAGKDKQGNTILISETNGARVAVEMRPDLKASETKLRGKYDLPFGGADGIRPYGTDQLMVANVKTSGATLGGVGVKGPDWEYYASTKEKREKKEGMLTDASINQWFLQKMPDGKWSLVAGGGGGGGGGGGQESGSENRNGQQGGQQAQNGQGR